VFVIEAMRFTADDERALRELVAARRPIVLVINKIDRVTPKEKLLPFIAQLSSRADFAAVVPLSALKRRNLSGLAESIARFLPTSPQLYPPEQITDASQQFMAAEIIREKLTLRLQDELPYGITVEIENLGPAEDEPGKLLIHAVIWVERTGQKAIVIGRAGERLKEIGRAARLELRQHFAQPVHLELWVKVKQDWSDDAAALRRFGFDG
jgi:GTP-binding protein Era